MSFISTMIKNYTLNLGAGTLTLPGVATVSVAQVSFIRNVSTGKHLHLDGSVMGFDGASGSVFTLSQIARDACNSDNDILEIAYAVSSDNPLPTSGGGGGGGGGSSDTTEVTQLAVLAELQSIDNKTPALVEGRQPVETSNLSNKFREAFESYDPVSGGRWTQQLASNDIIAVDGNAAAASYLVISKCPLTNDTESRISSVPTWEMPFEASIGLHMSQRTVGQEFATEFVSTETPLPTPSDVVIASISQATTTLSVTTSVPHNLSVGQRIGIKDCSDSRLNYPALVVATAPTPTTFTATAGPMGAIPSVTAGPFTTGSVYSRSAIGQAPNGTSMIFENGTATNASFYVRSESGDALPSGTITANHSVTMLTSASVQAVNAARNYAFQPSTEYRVKQFIGGLQWSDIPVDSLVAENNRYKRTQVVPDFAASYRIRFRARNLPSRTVPNAQIVSAIKSGSTTATITTDVAHGLLAGDLVVVYGIRDQAATAFPNLLTATAVVAAPTSTTFTIVIGSGTTGTSYGGYVAKVQGGIVMSSLGGIAQAVQNVTRTSNVLTLTGSAAWAGLVIGDYINMIGVRDNVSGASLGIDGTYRVRDIATTTLILEPIGSAPTGADIPLTDCGGALIKRTDMRISFVRALDFERQRVELLPRPLGDTAESAPVAIQNIPAVTLSGTNTLTTVTTVSALTGGGAAEDAAAGANPVVVGGVVRTAVSPTTFIAGDAVRDTMTSSGAKVMQLFAVPDVVAYANLSLTTTTAQALRAAGAAGVRNYCSGLEAYNSSGSAVDVIILDGVTEIWRQTIAPNSGREFFFEAPLRGTAATALNVNLSTAATSVRVTARTFQAP